ncbi:MAG TPA: insulinase family protein, partial [Planctomycetota bacterium]|nr:insulinase family protein [Planctomycetota bacterium]
TLIEWFQKHGMSFGGDTNAHTGFSETVYELDLATSDETALREGLTVLRDFADGASLIEKEVQAEKGIVDAEERERDSAGYRVLVKTLELALDGTRPAQRLPIGVKSVRDAFDNKAVRAFYEKWYRPDTMTLVVVGDFGALDPEVLIRAAFADMPSRPGPRPSEPALGKATLAHPAFAIHEKELPQVSVEFERVKPFAPRPETVAQWKSELPGEYARAMLNLRFSELAKKPDAPFLRARAYDTHDEADGAGIRVLEGDSIELTATPERWKDALAFGEQELRRALQHGFEKSELDEVRANVLRALDEAVEKEKTRSSMGYVNALLGTAEEGGVPVAATDRRAILKPAIEALTVEACHDAYKKVWSEGTLMLAASGAADFGADPAKTLRELYDASAKVKVEPRAAAKSAAFAYASSPEKAGKVASRRDVAEGIVEAELSNGVRVRVKKTDFKEREILVRVRTGGGRTALPPKDAAVAFAADPIVRGGGLGKHSVDDIRRLMAGKEVDARFRVGGDSLELSGSTTPDDLLLECELLCAGLTDPGWRDDGDVQFRRALPSQYEQMKHRTVGPLLLEFLPALFGGDLRFAPLPPQSDVEAATKDRVKAWILPQVARGPLEVAFVGDVDVDATLAAAARTFGAMPKREGKRDAAYATAPPPKTGIRMEREVESADPSSLVVVMFPVTDGKNAEFRRKIDFLAEVLSDRLRVDVREKLGAAYSPGAVAQLSRTFDKQGVVVIQSGAETAKASAMVDACLGVADKLAKEGVTQEEVDRLREPITKRVRDERRQNGFWAEVLSEAYTRPQGIDEVGTAMATFEKISAADLTPLAKEYLRADRACVFVGKPQEKPASAPANAAGEKSGG